MLEETGFDVSNLLNKDDYIEEMFGQQRVRLYIIAGVKDDTAFAPLTKKEISVCGLSVMLLVFAPISLQYPWILWPSLCICCLFSLTRNGLLNFLL